MFEDPPKKDETSSNVVNLNEWKDKKIETLADNKPKKIGRLRSKEGMKYPSPHNQEEMIRIEAKKVMDFISLFEKKFLSEADNKTQELRKNLYENREYIFWINAINFSQEIKHWEREFKNIQIKIKKNPQSNKTLHAIVESHVKNFNLFHFEDIDMQTETNEDPWVLLEKFEKFAKKCQK